MKLDLVLLLALAALASGCATRSGAGTGAGTAATPPAVGITTLRTAELTDAEEAPRVGKSQRSELDLADDAEPKTAPQRRIDRRPGGGFSGYK